MKQELSKANETIKQLKQENRELQTALACYRHGTLDSKYKKLLSSFQEKDQILANLFYKNEKLKRKLTHTLNSYRTLPTYSLKRKQCSLISEFVSLLTQQLKVHPALKPSFKHYFTCGRQLVEYINTNNFPAATLGLLGFITDILKSDSSILASYNETRSSDEGTLIAEAKELIGTLGAQTERIDSLNAKICNFISRNGS